MNRTRLQYLHEKYINDQMSPDELMEWKFAVRRADFDQEIQDIMDSHWLSIIGWGKTDLMTSRFDETYQEIIAHRQTNRLGRRMWPRISIAAAAAIIIFGVGFFFFKAQETDVTRTITVTHDINPGRHAATLTLANGKNIRLSDMSTGEIAREAGIVVSKTADGQLIYEIKGTLRDSNRINTLTTTKGETYILTLPDKSKVWMNAASSLTYSPILTENGIRKVKLQGEAYFEIFKDKLHPFVVETRGQSVEVLGTHFNVSSYADEDEVATTLLEGSVKINNNIVLKPGQQSILKSDKIKVAHVDTDAVVAWKNDQFMFEGQEFETVMRAIGRWYDVDVVFQRDVKDLHLSVQVPRTTKLNELIASLEITGDVKFKIEGRRIYVVK